MTAAETPASKDEPEVANGRRPRRAIRPAPEGTDPEPYDPPSAPRSESENDQRLRDDKPPHWGG